MAKKARAVNSPEIAEEDPIKVLQSASFEQRVVLFENTLERLQKDFGIRVYAASVINEKNEFVPQIKLESTLEKDYDNNTKGEDTPDQKA